MILVINLVSGFIFGMGLLISGMANPAKVLNFLDIAGTWDPSLAFVMAGAVFTAAIGYRFAFRRAKPVLDDNFHVTTSRQIDGKLIFGAAIFGLGWGLAGLCPGPALVSLVFAAPAIFVFVPAMVVGITLATWLKRDNGRRSESRR